MRMTRIGVQNFKGVGNSQTIELKPITLLFGTNSAGKNTILTPCGRYLRGYYKNIWPQPATWPFYGASPDV